MALFNIGKPKASPPSPAVKTAPAGNTAVSADDFFKDIDNRKKRPKKVDDTIDVPEVTGLRETPLPPPECTVKNMATDSLNTEGLRDKVANPDVFIRGDINEAGDVTVDDNILPDKTADVTPWSEEMEERRRAKKVLDPTSAEDFFSDIDRRKNRRGRIDPNIAAPDVTGLREAPEPPPVINIANAADNIDTDGMRDKIACPDQFLRGDINAVDTASLNMSTLRGEQ